MSGRSYEVIHWVDNSEVLCARFRVQIESGLSFKVMDVPFAKQGSVVDLLELALTNEGKKCRIRTLNRGWLVALAFVICEIFGAFISAIFPPLILGMIALAVIGAPIAFCLHRFATNDANYEIVKEFFGENVYVNRVK